VTQDVAELKNDVETEVMPTIEAVKMAAAKQSGAMSRQGCLGIHGWCAGAIGFAIHEMTAVPEEIKPRAEWGTG